MSQVVTCLDQPSSYRDNRSEVDRETERRLLAQSSTLYVGNLSFYTTEAQMYEKEGGGIKRTPCGFAFVEYFLHSEAVDSLRYISGTKVDERVIRCDIDPGYKEGRQFGRGKSGGQVRDEFRQEYDSGRGESISARVIANHSGGWGHQRLEEEKRRQEQERLRSQIQFDTYAAVGGLGGADVPRGEVGDRQKRERSEDDERREDEKRLRGERDDE
ncbi:uncharacterized protein IL334_003466 [Kwoniella shivajii]|uniref:Nuclear cap-binding protein subunit 2 n=1 Tax=Kwoniella shivajii TaxID=564305 RepID=A0ABZ1D1Q5_9TREE|nr:hypothetical protein IL334_003466 [Kwoniella shivajii]